MTFIPLLRSTVTHYGRTSPVIRCTVRKLARGGVRGFALGAPYLVGGVPAHRAADRLLRAMRLATDRTS